MHTSILGYGLWGLAFVNAAFFIFVARIFYKPVSGRDRRSFGMFSAFLAALFAETYGFPLTCFLLSGWLRSSSIAQSTDEPYSALWNLCASTTQPHLAICSSWHPTRPVAS